jgi:hypothetical protein
MGQFGAGIAAPAEEGRSRWLPRYPERAADGGDRPPARKEMCREGERERAVITGLMRFKRDRD